MWCGEGNHRWGLPSHWRVLSRPSSQCQGNSGRRPCPSELRGKSGPPGALCDGMGPWKLQEAHEPSPPIPRSWVGDVSDHREAILATMPCWRAAEMRRSSDILCVSRWSQRMWHSSRCRHCRGVRRGMALSSRTGAFPWRLVSQSNSRGRRCFDEFPRGLSLWCTPRGRNWHNLPIRLALVAAVKA